MRPPGMHPTAWALTLLLSGAGALAQQTTGTPVDRNVGDTGPNAASFRQAQPGIGQFGVGSLLLDRYSDSPYTPSRFDPEAGDGRVGLNHRYMLRSPGVTALIDRPDYVGPSPHGGWVANAQTYDGTEVLTLRGANTVFVLSPELLRPAPRAEDFDTVHNPYLVRPQTVGDPYALMRDTRVTGQRQTPPPPRTARPQSEHYVHPEIIERRRKLKEEAERKAREQAGTEAAADTHRADEE